MSSQEGAGLGGVGNERERELLIPERKKCYKRISEDYRIRYVKNCAQAVLLAYLGIRFLGEKHLNWVGIFLILIVIGMIWTLAAHIYENIKRLPETWWGEVGCYITYAATAGIFMILAVHVYSEGSPFVGSALPPLYVIT